MISQKIRRAFLEYFKSKHHAIIPSSPVIPHNDPTLLFINAGMNQFKDVFLGKSSRDYKTAATTQKCIRAGGKHNDLENVGHTSRHLTFFEMLGNFSFGDYFKKEAIQYAWEVSTEIFQFDPEKIWVSVYKDDEEAFALWEAFVPSKRIVRFGEKENFWSMGETGPCGPCSELLYDRGDMYGSMKDPTEDVSGERYLEFWNLVFMQFEKHADGSLQPLPKQSIDTGAGLERVASLKTGVETVFQTDILRSLIAEVETISKISYDPTSSLAPSFHVIADHIRSLSFAIADGVQPSNTDRGYVLRKILRRAVRYGRMLGLQQPFLARMLPRLVQTMREDFPELRKSQSHIAEILTIEEESFIKTLLRGGNILHQVIHASKTKDHRITGADAFRLKDTYGFPLEEIVLIAKDEHLEVDLPVFEQLEAQAKEQSRQAHKTAAQTFETSLFQDFLQTHSPCLFQGFDHFCLSSKIMAILSNGKFVSSLREGDEGVLLLDKTPFYAEMGGQVGDTGTISSSEGFFAVQTTTSPFPGIIAHTGKMVSGQLKTAGLVDAQIDVSQRLSIQNNHTATHLLHWALEKVLGSHIKQAGSLVEASRLRFDFHHHKPISSEDLSQIEQLINEKIRTNLPVKTYELSYQEAQKKEQIKQFFGEKYGDKVRVVDIDFSQELCGGAHTSRLGTIGLLKIVKESSIAAGIRRIEAWTGAFAERWIQEEELLLQKVSSLFKTTPASLLEKARQLVEENKQLTTELKGYRKEALKHLATTFSTCQEQVGSMYWAAKEVVVSQEELPILAEEVLQHVKPGVIAIGLVTEDKCQLVVAVSADLTGKVQADALIKLVAPCIQGGGGGKKHLAQAGGKNPQGLPVAFAKIKEYLQQIQC